MNWAPFISRLANILTNKVYFLNKYTEFSMNYALVEGAELDGFEEVAFFDGSAQNAGILDPAGFFHRFEVGERACYAEDPVVGARGYVEPGEHVLHHRRRTQRIRRISCSFVR